MTLSSVLWRKQKNSISTWGLFPELWIHISNYLLNIVICILIFIFIITCSKMDSWISPQNVSFKRPHISVSGHFILTFFQSKKIPANFDSSVSVALLIWSISKFVNAVYNISTKSKCFSPLLLLPSWAKPPTYSVWITTGSLLVSFYLFYL